MPPENCNDFSGQSTMSVWNEFKTSQELSVPPLSGTEVMADASICNTCAQVGHDLFQKNRSVRRKISGVSIHSSYLGLQSVVCTSLKASGYYDLLQQSEAPSLQIKHTDMFHKILKEMTVFL
jgi:hypothetical protein